MSILVEITRSVPASKIVLLAITSREEPRTSRGRLNYLCMWHLPLVWTKSACIDDTDRYKGLALTGWSEGR